MTERIIDQDAREKIVSQLEKNFLVEAGAGSGKTTSLVERIINIIITGKGKINEITAITFTRKAADDLKLRFLGKLEEKWKQEQNAKRKLRLEEAMKNIDSCFLGTVHAFCSRMLRERPVEAGLDPNFTELEEEDDRQIMLEAWQLYLTVLPSQNPKLLEQMNEIGIHTEQIQTFLLDSKDDPDVDWIVHHSDKPLILSAYGEFIDLLKEAESYLPAAEPDGGYDTLQQLIIKVLKKAKHIDEKNDSKIIEIFEMANKTIKVKLKNWPNKELGRHYEDKVKDFINVTLKPLLQQWKEYCHPIIVDILKGGLEQYERLKKSRSLVNFQDLLIVTTNLLKDNSEVRQYFQQKYRFLMIDEYQDSDPLQAELMFLLTAANPEEKEWTKCKPKPGSLFIVGDPKQAIYRFRRADIDTYNRVKHLICEHDGEVLQLTMNFRTIGGITKVLNAVFEKELPEKETKYQAAYRPLHSYFNNSGKCLEGIKTLTVPGEYTKKDDIIRKDADNIARCVRHLMNKGHEAKDFMILSRYSESIPVYAEALERLHIPVNISGEVILGDHKEIKELKLLLQFLSDPGDELTLVAVLRGIFFGVSDQDLYEWKRSGGKFSIYRHAYISDINENAKEKIIASLEMLRKYDDWVRLFTPAVALEKIMTDIGLYPLFLINSHSKQLFKSLLQIIEMLKKQESAGTGTFFELFANFSKMVEEKTTVANFESGGNAVAIMNVHKSKGLEAKIVFLANPVKKVDPAPMITKHINREDHGSIGHIAFLSKKGFQKASVGLPLNWEMHKAEEYAYLLEEEKRILYVAVTRAEEALIISLSEKSNKNNPWERFLHIEKIEEMSLPDMVESSPEREAAVSFSAEFSADISSMRFWLDNSQESSYVKWSPTEEKDYTEIADLERDHGGSMKWGSFIHDILEKLVNNQDMDIYMAQAMFKHQIPYSKIEEVNDYIKTVKRSFIWGDLKIADEVYTEVPIHLVVDQQSSLRPYIDNDTASEKVFVKGVIDLVYRINDNWMIIDYKTDRLHNWQEEDKLHAFYQKQLTFYREVWKQIVNSQSVQAELFFLEKEKSGFY
ncbi:UvrD-helicase domain-containing protein [Bacillus sp. AGMB 02131]|uniref:DNA 3'-5' helicase n=1 Tax=Peribacillus faecalis TaxID=2772559 RepID=A0A927CVM6_9BACI|nr:UvrD-helicase domain-containing protein [Peribacillus faecalis]MBD3108448.1 UvrD-helicase domain-containing protein [Peribacillus faecalis]